MNSFNPRKSPEAPPGELPKTGSFASTPSMRTSVQLGRMPLIETCPVLPFERNDGALLGVGATPGSKSRFKQITAVDGQLGSSLRRCSAMSPPTVEVVLSISLTSPLTVSCCGWLPTTSEKFSVNPEAEISVITSRTYVWNPSFSTRTE